MATLAKVGQGQVLFCADPIELSPEMEGWHRDLYLTFLRLTGAPRNAVTPDEATLRCFRVPLQDGGAAYVLFNNSDQAREVTLGDMKPPVKLNLSPRSPGLVAADHANRLLVVEAQGPVAQGSQCVVNLSGHAILCSVDGCALEKSKAMIALPLSACCFTFRKLHGMKAELGELRGTRWTPLEALSPDRDGQITLTEEQALNMLLVAEGAHLAAARRSVESFAAGPDTEAGNSH